MTVLIDLALATICFGQPVECHPILYGVTTPVGEFQMNLRQTLSPGYGGDVIQFDENDKIVFAIHRMWMLSPKQKRPERLKSTNIRDRVITNGCINVEERVYLTLKDCCSNDKLVITK